MARRRKSNSRRDPSFGSRREFLEERPLSGMEIARRDRIERRYFNPVKEYAPYRKKGVPTDIHRRRAGNMRPAQIQASKIVEDMGRLKTSLGFVDKKRSALRKGLTSVDKCVKRCKGKSSRKRGAWRGKTMPKFANWLKNRICEVRCR